MEFNLHGENGLGLYFSLNNIEVQLYCDEHNIKYDYDSVFNEYYISEPNDIYQILKICSKVHNITIY